MTVSDPFYDRILSQLTYPNPPAGFAAILINVGGSEPVVIHVDMHDGKERLFKFQDGEVSFHSDTEPVRTTLASPIDTKQPKTLSPRDVLMADSECLMYMQNGKKIQAIKRARELLNMGLKEAKDEVDAIFQREGWTSR